MIYYWKLKSEYVTKLCLKRSVQHLGGSFHGKSDLYLPLGISGVLFQDCCHFSQVTVLIVDCLAYNL